MSWNASAHVGAHPLKPLPKLVGGEIVYPAVGAFPATVAEFYSLTPPAAASLLAFYGFPAIDEAGHAGEAHAVLPARRAALAAYIGLTLS